MKADEGLLLFRAARRALPASPLQKPLFSAIGPAFDRPADKGCRGGRALLPESKTLAKPPQGVLAYDR